MNDHVFEDGRPTTCPDCDGDLGRADRQRITYLCDDCEAPFEHWKTTGEHRLVTADPATTTHELVARTPREEMVTDGGDQIADGVFQIDVRADENHVNTLVDGENVTVLVAWDAHETTKLDVIRACGRVERVLDHQIEGFARSRAQIAADGGASQ